MRLTPYKEHPYWYECWVPQGEPPKVYELVYLELSHERFVPRVVLEIIPKMGAKVCKADPTECPVRIACRLSKKGLCRREAGNDLSC